MKNILRIFRNPQNLDLSSFTLELFLNLIQVTHFFATKKQIISFGGYILNKKHNLDFNKDLLLQFGRNVKMVKEKITAESLYVKFDLTYELSEQVVNKILFDDHALLTTTAALMIKSLPFFNSIIIKQIIINNETIFIYLFSYLQLFEWNKI